MTIFKKVKTSQLGWVMSFLFLWTAHPFDIFATSVSFSGGEGTMDSPYLISQPADFETLRLQVQQGNRYEGVYFELTQPIDFKNYDNDKDEQNGNFKPIGSPTNPFSGHLNGKGYPISNVNLSGNETYLSFIGAQHGGSLKNLQFNHIKVQGTTVNRGVQYLSVVVGEANETYLKNISVNQSNLHSQADRGDRYLTTIASDIYHSRLEDILAQDNQLTGYASGCGVAYYSDDQTFFKNIFFNTTIETTYYQSPLVCYADAENFENTLWNEDRIAQPATVPGKTFTEEDLRQDRLPDLLDGFDLKTNWIIQDGIVQLLPDYQKNQLQIQGTVSPTIANLSLPQTPLSFVLNPNAPLREEQFIAPTFQIFNESHTPLSVSVRSLTSENQALKDVMPDFYEDWDALTKEESQHIALSLVTQPQDGWLTLENETYYAAESFDKKIGTIKANQSVSFDFDALHGRAFSESKRPAYRLTFVFDLLS